MLSEVEFKNSLFREKIEMFFMPCYLKAIPIIQMNYLLLRLKKINGKNLGKWKIKKESV
jgi:hypothetical protein